MENKQNYFIIIGVLVLLLGFGIFQILKQGEEIKGLKQSFDLVNDFLEEEKDKNTRLIDSLNNNSQSEIIEAQSKKIDSLLAQWKNLPKTPKYDKEIDGIDPADTSRIAREFTKFYPHNH